MYRLWQQVAAVLFVADGMAYIGGRYLHDGHIIYHFDFFWEHSRIQVMIGPGVYEHIIFFDQGFIVLPLGKGFNRIAAHDYYPFIFWVYCLQMLHGMDGIRRGRQVKFYIAGYQGRVVVDGQLHHIQAVVLVKQVFCFFERVLWGYYKPYLLQVGVLCKMVGNNQVPDMYRVK